MIISAVCVPFVMVLDPRAADQPPLVYPLVTQVDPPFEETCAQIALVPLFVKSRVSM